MFTCHALRGGLATCCLSSVKNKVTCSAADAAVHIEHHHFTLLDVSSTFFLPYFRAARPSWWLCFSFILPFFPRKCCDCRGLILCDLCYYPRFHSVTQQENSSDVMARRNYMLPFLLEETHSPSSGQLGNDHVLNTSHVRLGPVAPSLRVIPTALKWKH